MPKLLWPVVFAGLAAGIGQDIEIRPRFVAGDQFTINLTRTVEERREVVRTYAISRAVTVTVASVGTAEKDTVLRWRPGPGHMTGSPEQIGSRMALATLAVSDLDFRVAVNSRGRCVGVTNVFEVTPALTRARDALHAKVPGMSDPEVAARPPLSAENMASTVQDDCEMVMASYGLSQPVGQGADIPTKWGTPFGFADGTRRSSIVAATDDKADITISFAVDPVSLKRLIPGLEAAPGRIDYSENSRYVFDRRIGLNTSGTLEKTAFSGIDRRVERWEFSLSSPPRR